MKKTIKAVLVLFAILTGGIAHSQQQCTTVFDFNTGKYTKVCCDGQGRCTVFTF